MSRVKSSSPREEYSHVVEVEVCEGSEVRVVVLSARLLRTQTRGREAGQGREGRIVPLLGVHVPDLHLRPVHLLREVICKAAGGVVSIGGPAAAHFSVAAGAAVVCAC